MLTTGSSVTPKTLEAPSDGSNKLGNKRRKLNDEKDGNENQRLSSNQLEPSQHFAKRSLLDSTVRFVPSKDDKSLGILLAGEYILKHYLNPLKRHIHSKGHNWDSFKRVLDRSPETAKALPTYGIPDKKFLLAALNLVKERDMVAHPRRLEEMRSYDLSILRPMIEPCHLNIFEELVKRFNSNPSKQSSSTPRPSDIYSVNQTEMSLTFLAFYNFISPQRNESNVVRLNSGIIITSSMQEIKSNPIWLKMSSDFSKSQLAAIQSILRNLRNRLAHPEVSHSTLIAYAKHVLADSSYYNELLAKVLAQIEAKICLTNKGAPHD